MNTLEELHAMTGDDLSDYALQLMGYDPAEHDDSPATNMDDALDFAKAFREVLPAVSYQLYMEFSPTGYPSRVLWDTWHKLAEPVPIYAASLARALTIATILEWQRIKGVSE